jgi:hypothetical protein
LGILIIPTGTAAGAVIYKDMTSTEYALCPYVNEGDQIIIENEVKASSAGAGHPWFIVEYIPEVAVNNSAMTATA